MYVQKVGCREGPLQAHQSPIQSSTQIGSKSVQFARYGLDRVAGVESEEQGIAKDLESPEGQEVQVKLVAACAKHRSFEDSIRAAKQKKLETDRKKAKGGFSTSVQHLAAAME